MDEDKIDIDVLNGDKFPTDDHIADEKIRWKARLDIMMEQDKLLSKYLYNWKY